MAGCQIPHTEGRDAPLCLLLLEVSDVHRICRQACLELLSNECELISPHLSQWNWSALKRSRTQEDKPPEVRTCRTQQTGIPHDVTA